MFTTLKRMYDNGQLNEEGLRNAVEKKPLPWITKEQFKEITGKDYDEVIPEPEPEPEVILE